MSTPPTIITPRAPKRFAQGHPWLYSNEMTMDGAAKSIAPGSVVRVEDGNGKFLARAHFNPHSLIAARVLTREDQLIDVNFWAARLKQALALRETLFDEPFYRLAHGEADAVPGLILDRYGETIVMQANTAGTHQARQEILEALEQVIAPKAVLLRGDAPSRTLEGLAQENEIFKGEIPPRIELRENGLTYLADLQGGQKTGWFYDQRRNRALAAELAPDKGVLDLYAHSGGFGLLAAKHGAKEVLCVDSSKPALALAKEAAAKNGLGAVDFAEEDVFKFCERQTGKKYDLVIADPPPFARSKKDVGPASRGYRKLARLASNWVVENGFLFIFSCSHAITRERFDEEVLRGAEEAGRKLRILARTGADLDHPLHPHLPESAYLKGLFINMNDT